MKPSYANMDQPISPRIVPRYQIQCVDMIRRSTCFDWTREEEYDVEYPGYGSDTRSPSTNPQEYQEKLKGELSNSKGASLAPQN